MCGVCGLKRLRLALGSKGIVHRDIKPENILYTESSKDSAVKLADYGLSRCFEAEDLNQGRIRMMSRVRPALPCRPPCVLPQPPATSAACLVVAVSWREFGGWFVGAGGRRKGASGQVR